MTQQVTADVFDKKESILVAAIDFGTTFSGYAYMFREQYLKDPTAVTANQKWNSGTGSQVSSKAPTCVLFDNDKNLRAFGYEAEEEYADIALDEAEEEDADVALDGDHKNYYYFKRFKMKLHEKQIHRDTLLEDDNGRKLPAIFVFGQVIKYLKDHLLDALGRHGNVVNESDIHFVLTVPAIWSDSAKQFMREAAYEAGINGPMLSIALEPEAASIYCQLSPQGQQQASVSTKFSVSTPGTKYMVIDLGGGTADVTVHERQEDGGLKELHKASGGAWGGTKVDEEFNQLLIRIISAQVLGKVKKTHQLDLQRELETRKRTVKPGLKTKITMNVPHSLRKLYDDEMGESIDDAVSQSPYRDKITWMDDKIRVHADVFNELFKKCIDAIVTHVKNLLQKPEVTGTKIFLLVGGFSESPMVQEAIDKAFPEVTVVIPEDASLTVVKGAVVFGHQPAAITSRKAKYTYGINISPPFDPRHHSDNRKVTVGGIDRCNNVFKRYIVIGDSVTTGEVQKGKHVTIKPGQTEMLLGVYVSSQQKPQYVDEDDSKCIGSVVVKLPRSDGRIRVEVGMMFGETELMVEAQEEETRKKFRAYFDFL